MSDLPPAPVPPADPPPAPGGDPKPEPKLVPQSDVDRIVQERLARQKAQFADYDDVKAKAAKFDELDAANKSELEKAQARAEAAEKKAADATTRAETVARRSALLAEATKAGAVDAETVAQLVDGSAVVIGADGTVSGAAEAVAALLESRPFLKATPNGPVPVPKPTPGFDGGARPGGQGVTADQLRGMTARQVADLDPKVVEAALKSG